MNVIIGDERMAERIKRLRCANCKTDCTVVMSLLLDAAVEEAKITGKTTSRSYKCPRCATVGVIEVTPPDAQ